MAAIDFNNRRAAYKRQVSQLRKQYAEEVAMQAAADKAEQEAIQRERTRKRLERQRAKNERSALSALRQEQIRQQRAKEFEEHLRVMQQRREAKEERYRKARQLVVDELEKEAPLWLTTRDEVDAAFDDHEICQKLWAPKRGGILGAPSPSLDAHFWQYETHTWHMGKTYKSQREVLKEELEELAYEEANVDPNYWTEERLEEQRQLETKSKLRAMVHSAGRLELLRKQRRLLAEYTETSTGDGVDNDLEASIPKPEPVPNLRVLQDDTALEREGAQLLMDDPTRFFVFDRAGASADDETEVPASLDSVEDNTGIGGDMSYSGPTLGSPTGLRDPLREGNHQRSVFPQIIGKLPKPDTRTEREKKQAEREERLLAAAARAAAAEGAGDRVDAIELAAQNRTVEDLQPDLDYDALDAWEKEDDEEWKKGLDPTADTHILNTPRERRYSADDIEWVVTELEDEIHHLEQQFQQDIESLKRTMISEARPGQSEEAEGTVGKESQVESHEESLGAALLAMSEKELWVLSDLHDRYTEEGPSSLDALVEIAATELSGLTEGQFRAVMEQVGENEDENPSDG